MNTSYRIFGQNLHYLIRAKGVGMRAFAREAGIDYSLLKRYMSGQVAPRKHRLEALSALLGVSPGSLMFDDLVPEIEESTNVVCGD
jgi:transcriptional regulator with XRE-family HTH domain